MLINKVILHLFAYSRAVVVVTDSILSLSWLMQLERDNVFFFLQPHLTADWCALDLKRLVAKRFLPVNLEKILEWVKWEREKEREFMWECLKKKKKSKWIFWRMSPSQPCRYD